MTTRRGGPPVPPWARRCGQVAIAAALPTVVWRVVVGAGLPLGTPATWRDREDLPGPGTWYVLLLSAMQLVAALLTFVLVTPGRDRVPAWSPVLRGRRLPGWLVVGAASVGTAVLALICVLSVVNWGNVDPFAEATTVDGWLVLCWACYLAALLWPVFLVPAIVGYAKSR